MRSSDIARAVLIKEATALKILGPLFRGAGKLTGDVKVVRRGAALRKLDSLPGNISPMQMGAIKDYIRRGNGAVKHDIVALPKRESFFGLRPLVNEKGFAGWATTGAGGRGVYVAEGPANGIGRMLSLPYRKVVSDIYRSPSTGYTNFLDTLRFTHTEPFATRLKAIIDTITR